MARGERLLVVLIVLLGAAVLRFDHSVRAATLTDWVRAKERAMRAEEGGLFDWCVANSCPRLPASGIHIYIGTSVALAAALVVWIVLAYRIRKPSTAPEDKSWAAHAPVAIAALAVVCAGAGVVALYARARYGDGDAGYDVVVRYAPLVQVLAFAIAFLLCARLGAHAAGALTLRSRVFTFVERQRGQVLLVAAYVGFVLLVPITSGQVLDALRVADITTSAGASSGALTIGTSVLLATVLYECALRLEKAPGQQPIDVPWWGWGVGGVCVLVFGVAGQELWVLGDGLVIAGAILLVLAAAELVAYEVGTAPDPPPASPARWAEYLAIAPLLTLAAAAVIAGFDVLVLERHEGWALASLIVLLAVVVAVAVAMTRRDTQSVTIANPGASVTVAVWGTSALVLVAVAVGLVVASPDDWVLALAGVAFAIAAIAYAWHVFVGFGAARSAGTRQNGGWSIPVAVAAALGVTAALHVAPLDAAPVVGTVALVNVAAALAAVALFALVIGGRRLQAPGLLNLVGVHRLPILVLVGAWWVLAGLAAPDELHDVRLVARTAVATEPDSLESAVSKWVRAQPEFGTPRPPGERGHTVPMVLVASHGGGMRAAYWTARVLDCIVGTSPFGVRGLDERNLGPSRESTCGDRRRTKDEARAISSRIFLASGVSGGAVGLYAYGAQMNDGGFGDDSWVDERLGGDVLSPVVGWALFHDLPNHLLGISPDRGGACVLTLRGRCMSVDRAAILEDALDAAGGSAAPPLLRGVWDARTALDPEERERARSVPLLLTNATTPTGARAVAAAVGLADWPNEPFYDGTPEPMGQVAEVSDMLCNRHDVRLSTAAVLGARFPLVSPAGRIHGNCQATPGDVIDPADYGTASCATADGFCTTQMVDGGYVDNSGLLTLVELWPRLLRAVAAQNARTPKYPIAPVIVEIDNHYEDEVAFRAPPSAEPETSIPAKALLGNRNAIQEHARSFLVHERPSTCFVSVRPQAHPGLTAPLGWALSSATRSELTDALTRQAPSAQGASENWPIYRLRRLQQWLEPGRGDAGPFTPALESCVPK